MTDGAKSLLMWEDNPDTPISASNLSKTIDVISESKFIYYEDTIEGYEKWADIAVDLGVEGWPSIGSGISGEGIEQYVGKTVYNINDKLVKMGLKSDDIIPYYSWLEMTSPYKKLLTILPYTKIGTKYIDTENNNLYSNFDSGSTLQVFSIDSLLVESDYSANTVYYIYIYHYTTYEDYSKIKIVSDFDDSNGEYGTNDWKLGPTDEASPTGHRVISYRRIGGFKTDVNKYVMESSVWDISIVNTQIISNSYKVLDEEEIRDFRAEDLPIEDQSSLFNSINVETALQEIKLLLDSVREDVYFSDTRFGVDLKFSPLKKDQDNNLVEIAENQDEITLKITAGYIDVIGSRVKIEEDIYIASTFLDIKINEGSYSNPGDGSGKLRRALGGVAEHTIYDGIWRCYINTQGSISFVEDTIDRAVYKAILKGWYNSNGARCIGKFKVLHDVNHFFIQKMSITGTYDEKAPINTMFMYHGTMCPDGLIACDGRWHDVNGLNQSTYETMPQIISSSGWQSGEWYEDTPNMWDRTVKMISEQDLPFDTEEFKVNYENATVFGSSENCGSQNDLTSSMHDHQYIHYHTPGELRIAVGGEHVHESDEFYWNSTVTDGSPETVSDVQTGGVQVPSMSHRHTIYTIASGKHSHSEFTGITGFGSQDNTDETSSWSPYKEILFCIKK